MIVTCEVELKAELLAGIGDADRLIRQTVGTCIATFAGVMGSYGPDWLVHWPELMPTVTPAQRLLCPSPCPCGSAARCPRVATLAAERGF